MVCDEEYNSLIKATERLHELYYQQESADAEFSNVRNRIQDHLIASGLARLVNASPAEIVYSLEGSSEEWLVSLHDAAVVKVQADVGVLAAEESYRYASQRYEDCIKGITNTQENL